MLETSSTLVEKIICLQLRYELTTVLNVSAISVTPTWNYAATNRVVYAVSPDPPLDFLRLELTSTTGDSGTGSILIETQLLLIDSQRHVRVRPIACLLAAVLSLTEAARMLMMHRSS
ncbi:hypothetical protein H2248_008167 [Termitomyces sp. 'cryptogamus']|nr:hypothetical protein H2248_008167 [Termitomyces sp. 'cryptogamus']